MTTAEAKKLGYEIVRGSYQNTPDDRLDRWYIQLIDSRTVDRRGPGFRTRRDALDYLAHVLAER